MKTEFSDVIKAWRNADPDHIHPLRKKNLDDYWSSGVSQALEVAEFVPQGGSIIDFGCGDGRIAVPLALMGYDVLAVDASPEMLERLEANAAEQGVHIDTLVSNGLDLREQIEGSPDAIVCRAVLIHHSYEDGERLVRCLSRILSKGGHLVVDWPIGTPHERRDWIDVTVWDPAHRIEVAKAAHLQIVHDGTPSVWVRV